jgi:class 3 adenylate cyclase/tetratricopeptide (TPR) repeat protein
LDIDIAEWLEAQGLGQYAAAFAAHRIDGTVLASLTDADLKEIGVLPLGHRKRLLAAIARLAEAPAATAAELRQVTVLFADIAGYTRLSAALDPETVHQLLDRFFEAVDEVVARYGGTIDKHIGDNVMAVFGAPIAHDDDPERAVRAALDMQAAAALLSETLGREIRIHIGIASGQVMASGTGSRLHRAYTVIGDSVNLAARLQALAGPGETLISEPVHRAVQGRILCDDMGAVSIRGLDGTQHVWRVRGPAAHADAGADRPLVDRRGEMARFRRALADCRETGAGCRVDLQGEAGIGKSRLVSAFIAVAGAAGFACHRANVVDFGAGKGRDAIRDLVRSLLGVPVDATMTALSQAADRAIAEGKLAPPSRVFLYDLLDLPQPAETRALYDAMEGVMRARGMRDTVAALVEEAARHRPLLAVVEDAHWADRETLRHLSRLAETVERCPAILLVTARVSPALAAPEKPAPVAIELGPLPEEDALALARNIADGGGDADRVAACVRRAEGNPLFLEQLLLAAQASGGGTDGVPASIQSLVLARIDRLPAAQKQALQAASVLGLDFRRETLGALIDDPSFDPAPLIARRLLGRRDGGLAFAHALVRDGVYGSLPQAARRRLHGRAAELFADSDPVLHAEHLERAGDGGAAAACLRAGQALAADFRFERAIEMLERAHNLAADDAIRWAALSRKGNYLRRLGAPLESIAACREALDVAPSAPDRCRALIGIAAGIRLLGGRDAEGLAALDEAERLARPSGLHREASQIHYYRGNFRFAAGDIAACLTEQAAALAAAERAGDAEWEARSLGGLADAHYAHGRMQTALGFAERCIALCRDHGFGRIEVANRFMLGLTRRYLNQGEAALASVVAAAEHAGSVGNRRAEMYATNLVGEFLVDRGDIAGGEAAIDRALAMAERLGNRRFRAYVLMERGRALIERGATREAAPVLDEAIAISRATGIAFIGPRILAARARIAPDAAARATALGEGEATLAQGATAHNHLWFRRDAIEAALAAGDWREAERQAAALAAFTAVEPVPWADFFIARGRALARCGRDGASEADRDTLRRLQDAAGPAGLAIAMRAVQAALAGR